MLTFTDLVRLKFFLEIIVCKTTVISKCLCLFQSLWSSEGNYLEFFLGLFSFSNLNRPTTY